MKLIDLLVKELPKRGGWPEGAIKIHQDYDGETWAWLNNGSTKKLFTLDKVAVNARKFNKNEACENMVTSDQYEAALAASKAVVAHNGWIHWAGGECPIDSDAIVEVKYRKPSPYQFNNDGAGDFTWSHDGFGGDIIAYRLQQHGIDSRANDEQLEQDLNECIGHGVTSEWDGEGLPPVGAEFEHSFHADGFSTWHWRRCTAVGKRGVLCVDEKDTELYLNDTNNRFRPIRSETDKKRDEAIQGMASIIDYRNGCSSKPLAGWIYEAIAAGKIPGIKMKDK